MSVPLRQNRDVLTQPHALEPSALPISAVYNVLLVVSHVDLYAHTVHKLSTERVCMSVPFRHADAAARTGAFLFQFEYFVMQFW